MTRQISGIPDLPVKLSGWLVATRRPVQKNAGLKPRGAGTVYQQVLASER